MKLRLTKQERVDLAAALHIAACGIARVWDVEGKIEARVGREINFPKVGDFATDLATSIDDPDIAGPPPAGTLMGFEEQP